MSGKQRQSLSEILRLWNFFEECLLYDLRLVRFGYSVDLVINNVWDHGRVRSDALDNPSLVTLRLDGVESMNLVGGLTQAMRNDPEAINWGLSEIARIVPIETDAKALGLRVEWENSRQLTVNFLQISITCS